LNPDAAAPTEAANAAIDAPVSVHWRLPAALSTQGVVNAGLLAARAQRLVSGHTTLSRLFAPREDALLGRDELAARLFSPAFRLTEGARGDAVFASWGRYADEATNIGTTESSSHALRMTRVGAAHAAGELNAGRLIFSDAFPSTDLVVTASEGRSEGLLLLRDEHAPTRFSWRIELGSAIGKLEPDSAGRLIAVSNENEPVLRIVQPLVIDSKQIERMGVLNWDGKTLTLEVDVRGLSFPIAVDPAVESYVWAPATVTGAPPQRQFASAAFDSVHGQLVVYGGRDATTTPYNTTLLLANQAWSTAPAPGAANDPGPLRNHSMAFNGTSVVLYGGHTGAAPVDKTWLWNGSGWTEDTDAARPVARYGAAMAFAGSGKVLLYGGVTNGGETWEYNGNWTQDCLSPACSSSQPSARGFAAMAYEGGSNVLLFGGADSSGDNDETWEWNGSSWTQKCLTCTGTQKPALRHSHTMVWDSNRQRVVLFGGTSVGVAQQDTWEWTGTVWVQTGSTGPSVRSGAVSGYDSTNKHTVLFGGLDDSNHYLSDTWFYHTRGSDCSTAADCDTGFCSDGKCCETACNTACKTCAGSTWGVCENVGSAAGTDDLDTCTGSSTCNAAGACKTKQGKGCGLGSECLTNSCVDGTCCGGGCTTPCRSCANSAGTCTTVVTNGNDDNCSGANTCDASGTCKKDLGQTCTAGQCASGNCIDGHCCSDTCTTACRSCANSAGTCTTVVSSADDDNCNGANTCDASGACKKDKGQGCANNGDCSTGKCVGNVCCNTDCAGACDSCATGTCTVSPVGSVGAPSCSPFVCSGTANCPTSCTSDTQCQADSFCDLGSGKCLPDLAVGTACVRATQCKNNQNCVDGFCCDGGCTGACKACSNAKKGAGADGVCDIVVDGGPPRTAGGCPVGGSTCQADGKCDGQGACRSFSPANKTCGNTVCVNNAVSGSLCDGKGDCVLGSDAQPCAPSKCAVGGCTTSCKTDDDCDPQTGFCGPLKTCVTKKDSAASCGSDAECTTGHCADGVCCNTACAGACDACNLPGKTGQCTLVDPGSDGTPSCSPYVCAPKQADCPDNCTDNSVCGSKFYCKISNNTCQPRINGIACEADDQCPDGHCVDGACCESACDGVCETCAAKGTEGKCTVVKGDPVTGLGKPATLRDCPGDVGCEGSCDGKTRDQCTALADVDTACGDASCAANIAKGGKCTADGTCKVGETACTPYVCDATTCKTACTSASDCAAGFDCAGNVCVPSASNGVCSDDKTQVLPPNGMGTPTACAPYICQDGMCKSSCAALADCQTGYICDTSKAVGQCVQTDSAAAAPSNSGCGCRVASPNAPSQRLAWLGLGALGLFGLRRRRQRNCHLISTQR